MQKVVKDEKFSVDILSDVTVINFTEQERSKIKSFLMSETGNNHLFTYISTIYKIIGANFNEPGKFLVIPFVNHKNQPHINIQKIS